MIIHRNILIFLIIVIFGACGLTTTRPKLEMSFAAAAFMAAKKAKAHTLSPGLYRKAELGEIENLIGVSATVPFEPPNTPDLTIDTHQMTIDEGTRMLLAGVNEWLNLGKSKA